ncbi:MAG: hypothetical protein DGJ47_000259 [Rickettsiaceae bacterium]
MSEVELSGDLEYPELDNNEVKQEEVTQLLPEHDTEQERFKRNVVYKYSKCMDILGLNPNHGNQDQNTINKNLWQLENIFSDATDTELSVLFNMNIVQLNELNQTLQTQNDNEDELDKLSEEEKQSLEEQQKKLLKMQTLLEQEHFKRNVFYKYAKCMEVLEVDQNHEDQDQDKINKSLQRLKNIMLYANYDELVALLKITFFQANEIVKVLQNKGGSEDINEELNKLPEEEIQEVQKIFILNTILTEEHKGRVIKEKQRIYYQELAKKNSFQNSTILPDFIAKPLFQIINYNVKKDASKFKLSKPRVNSFIGQDNKIINTVSLQEFEQALEEKAREEFEQALEEKAREEFEQAVAEKAQEEFNTLQGNLLNGIKDLITKSPEFIDFHEAFKEQTTMEQKKLNEVYQHFTVDATKFIESKFPEKYSVVEISGMIDKQYLLDQTKQISRIEEQLSIINNLIYDNLNTFIKDLIDQEASNFEESIKQYILKSDYRNGNLNPFSHGGSTSTIVLNDLLGNIENYRQERVKYFETALDEIEAKLRNQIKSKIKNESAFPKSATAEYIAGELEDKLQDFLKYLEEGNFANTNTQNDVADKNELAIVSIDKHNPYQGNSYENILYNINNSKPTDPSNFHEKE